jgi:hypothetical protein
VVCVIVMHNEGSESTVVQYYISRVEQTSFQLILNAVNCVR